MKTTIYPMRLSAEDRKLFRSAAKRKQVSVADFLRTAARREALQLVEDPASLELSRQGFTLPDRAGSDERERVRAAIEQRHVSR
jgi:uncharacterized protein (DUF1778 family)